jgi:hypothetical protein
MTSPPNTMNTQMTTIFKLLFLALLIGVQSVTAAPPAGYKLAFQSNFHGRGGNADGWLPISEYGPLPNPYVLGAELWYPEFIAHTPDGRDFGYAAYTPAIASQGWGRMTWAPQFYANQWHGILLSTVDNQIHGFSVSPPFYATVLMSLPTGRDVWPAFWMTTCNRILPRPQTTNSAEIDVIEMYGNAPYTQEIHTATRDPNGNNLTSSADFAYNPGALNQYGQFYSVWVENGSEAGTIHFYVESATWDAKPAGDIHEVFHCPFQADMQQPWYLMIDYAMQDRSWTGQPYTFPTSMWVQQFNVWKP